MLNPEQPDPLPPYNLEPDSSESASEGESSHSGETPEPMDHEDSTAANNLDEAGAEVETHVHCRGHTKKSKEKSEFEPNDAVDHFELWSSDVTSPDEDDDMEGTRSSPAHKLTESWTDTPKQENIIPLKFKGTEGIINLDMGRKYSALECFKLFVDDDIIHMMVRETNKNARANFIRYGYHEDFLSGWLDVTFKEMTQFLGIVIFMAFKRLPETSSYWSTERLYFNSVACRVFTQTRFHRILTYWHFGNDGTRCVYAKLNPLLAKLNENFRKYKIPGDILYVGRTTCYLRNKYIFEPIPQDITKKGSKILKVMDQDIYTYKIKVLPPEVSSNRIRRTTNNTLDLLADYMDQGRLIIFHNIYISLHLARELLRRQCHSIGMIRKNSRGTPKEIETKPLQDGDLIGYQNSKGISVLKWQLLGAPYHGVSTCHTLETIPVQRYVRNYLDNGTTQEEEQIPKYLKDISLSEKIFDAYEKFSINTSPLNEHVKWYQRLACDAIVNTATINALILYKQLNKEKIKMWDFRDRLFRELVDIKQLPNISSDEEMEEPDLED
ncbi:piggyBac transposable element-derived protein 5-like [Anthonomus grandis grandis]|uniref:piggyBac transposable element-derived protein 5-like n=1 Tax=Anthonomus grandis grandis TaxID=2921223 RepID=UPI0021658BAC|nr:piggyBac transposable element-derived protein 5-like [Anthonomus grandis grandis]XP_050301714.1 piggyBac transposable element-derived protein 5-like [Anthonomus grandis grandis]